MKIIFLSFLFLVSCKNPAGNNFNPLESYLNPDSGEDKLSVIEEYAQLVNDYRHDVGLNALRYSKEIEGEAQLHSQSMATGGVAFGHTGSSSRCKKIITAFGRGNLCGEIVAMGQKTPKEVFKAWMNSPAHKSKIDNSRYTHTGVGFAKNAKGAIYWTQIFLEVL